MTTEKIPYTDEIDHLQVDIGIVDTVWTRRTENVECFTDYARDRARFVDDSVFFQETTCGENHLGE